MRYPASYPKILSDHFQTIFVTDLETTGFDPWRCEILTMSLSALDYLTLERKGSVELTFKPKNLQYWDYIAPSKKPPKKPKKKASEVHGISLSQALYFDDKKKSTGLMMEFFWAFAGDYPQILVCHAFDMYRSGNFLDVAFIMAHLEKMGRRWEFLKYVRFFESTETYFRAARAAGYYRSGFDLFSQPTSEEDQEGEDFKLDTLCRHYKIPLEHHNSKSDREACEELYRKARSLGTNEEEATFDLQGEHDWNGERSRESMLGEIHNSNRRSEDSDLGEGSQENSHVRSEIYEYEL